MSQRARERLARIHALAPRRRVRILNVCGGHERSITRAGLRDVLPETVELIPGPGCPVCVCPENVLATAIDRALGDPGVILASFGDMLRVPVLGSNPRTLEGARAAGADVRPVASPVEVRALAEGTDRPVVFLAAGFETTMAPVAAMLAEGVPENLALLLAGRLTWPAVAHLLDGGEAGFEGLIAPGHVATVMGSEQWRFVAEEHGIPTAVAGFSTGDLLAGIEAVLAQMRAGEARLENAYPAAVRPLGNRHARTLLDTVFSVADADWRGIGRLPGSGYALAGEHARRALHPADGPGTGASTTAMPPGCQCSEVVLGRRRPDGCPLYGRACRPDRPVGPCMVSDEGACRIWWEAGIRAGRQARAVD